MKTFPLARKNGIKDGEKWLETGMMDSLAFSTSFNFLKKNSPFMFRTTNCCLKILNL